MLIDKTLKSNFQYTYSIVQIKTFTHEIYNAGIILKDEIGKEYTFFADIKNKLNCIKIHGSDDINFLLNQIKNNLSKSFFNIEDYRGVSITQPKIYTTDKNPQNTLDELIDTYISIKPFLHKTARDFSIYDKREVHKKLKEYALQNDINNFKAGKHFKIAYKPIDLALVDTSNNPYSIAAMTSPHVDNFKDSFVTNIFTLQEAIKKSSSIKTHFLYAPVFDDISSINKKRVNENIGWAKEQAKEYSFDILTDSREAAAIEMLQY